jgi:hypothetical protein
VARNPQIVVEYVAKTAELKSSLDDAAKSTGRFSDKLKGIAKGGAIAAGAAGIGGLVATLKVGVGEWQESTKIAAQTGAVIKSTGGAAKVTAGHVSTLAESLMKKSGVDDEAIASGENLLLTFTNIRNEAGKGNDVFDQTTKAALDMSVALGTDMKASAMQLGKALNDPIKGVSKLTKQGESRSPRLKKSRSRPSPNMARRSTPRKSSSPRSPKNSAGRPRPPAKPCPASSTSSARRSTISPAPWSGS